MVATNTFFWRSFLFFSLFLGGWRCSSAGISSLSFQHEDWELVCDNTRTCRAVGYQSNADNKFPVSVMLTRRAGPSQAVEVSMSLNAQKLPLRISIDDRDLGVLPVTDNKDKAILNETQTRELLKALTRSSKILIGNGISQPRKLSDKGAAAVLLKMDEFQGRLGTQGALIRKGNRDEAGVFEALPLHVVRIPVLAATNKEDAQIANDSKLFDDLRFSGAYCELLNKNKSTLSITRLNQSKLLVSTLCWKTSYNDGLGFWIINAESPYEANFVTSSANGFMNGQIFSKTEARNGDCWSKEEWSWDGENFILTKVSGNGLCKVLADDPLDLPSIVSDVIMPKNK